LASNPRIILATSTNEAYWPRTEKCLRSYNAHSILNIYCLPIDWNPTPDGILEDGVYFPRVNSADLQIPLNNFCIQHGEFTNYIPGDPSDVILFTDADLVMQRPFNVEELATLRGLKTGQVFVGYNAGPQDRLGDEAHRLGLKVPLETLAEWWDLDLPCFNWGCVAATRETWEAICEIYVENWPIIDAQLHHVAKQQWLLSAITGNYFDHVEMPTSFHAHYHYGMPEGCEYKNWLVFSGGELALFQHRFDR
jgi:hypothetical protein